MFDPKLSPDLIPEFHTNLINRCSEHRQGWESDAKLVALSYKGNKYPTLTRDETSASRVSYDKDKGVYLNMIKRQYRVMSNYLTNNEPTYLITGSGQEFRNEDSVNAQAILDETFEGPLGDEGEGDMTFYDTQMDDVVFFGLQRGIAWTLAWHDGDSMKIKFKTFDPFDVYVDIDARKTTQIKDFVFTYVKSKNELEAEYTVDAFEKIINWAEVNTDKDPTMSEAKKCILKEKDPQNQVIVREGYHVVYEKGSSPYLVRLLTTRGIVLEKTEHRELSFIPVSPFVPNGEPEELFPRSWYSDMLPLDRKINEVVAKFSKIVDTGGRYVYVRKGTKLSKGTDKVLNSLGVEIIEVANAQEVPQQANIMTISQQDIYYLEFLMKQAEEEGGMKSDIMGSSSLGAEASGRAIQALQAGSKNNMGQALNELNKYMSRLVRVVLELHKLYSKNKKYATQKEGEAMPFDASKLGNVSVRVSVTARNAFDEVTQQQQGMQLLEYLARLSPDTRIKPETITKILGLTNRVADDIQRDLDEQENPDAQIAEGENRKMMNGQPVTANETDDHRVHMAMHSEMLQSFPPESDAAAIIIEHIRMHEAFASVGNGGKSLQPVEN